MSDSKHIEKDPVEGSRSNVDKQLQENNASQPAKAERRPDHSFPPFDDPANSPAQAGPPVRPTAPPSFAPSEDPIFAGHPDFSQEAASNKPPKDGMGLTRPLGETSEETRQSDGQGPSVASPPEEITKKDVERRPL